MQAIQIKFLDATSNKPRRILAKAVGGRIEVAYHGRDYFAEMTVAAEKLIDKLDWDVDITGWGSIGENGDEYVFTVASKHLSRVVTERFG